MLDFDTFSLIAILGGMIILAGVAMHYNSCCNLIRKKRCECEHLSYLLERKIHELEEEIVDLQIRKEEIEKQITDMQQ